MVASKARLAIKQYMKAKPTKWGLNSFVFADVNGYIIDFTPDSDYGSWIVGLKYGEETKNVTQFAAPIG